MNTTLNTTAPTILMGGSPRIRFGMKVANAGDLDADGISGTKSTLSWDELCFNVHSFGVGVRTFVCT